MEKDMYIAHGYLNNDSLELQSVSAHNKNVAILAMKNAPLSVLSSIVWICGILHDAGKLSDAFQNYIKRAINNEETYRGEVDHSTAGGYILEQVLGKGVLTQMVQMAVFSHHGMNDGFSVRNDTIFIDERLKKNNNLRGVEERYFQIVDRKKLLEQCERAEEDRKNIFKAISDYLQENNTRRNQYGSGDFYLGMYERCIFSLLIDADRTDTACFMQQRELPLIKSDDELQTIWIQSINHMEKYLQAFKKTTRLDDTRSEISEKCMRAGMSSEKLYRLTVPTGAGKTLSSLRFALHHAKKYHKKHIIYVAPYQSIIDQNAEEIRKAVGNVDIVLEHHCNVIHEEEKKRKQYELLTENWGAPIIITTAVQFLNTLFAGGNGNIRRMYNILDSVIVFDEVQSLPVKITKMYNLAVNFLVTFGKSTVVLCSATQPLFDELDENMMLSPVNMVGEIEKYSEVFKRTTVIDETLRSQKGFSVETLKDFILEKTETVDQILVIVNTKKCAENVYEELKEQSTESGYLLFHLSTNMCAENRREVLRKIELNLKEKRKLICVSTQLIEAGVNLSFQCVIRSIAGLDSIIQAAGRCNRHGEVEMGYVYIVQMEKEAENIDRIKDIQKAQDCMREVLNQFKIQPDNFDNDLTSRPAIRLFYQLYMRSRRAEMEFPVSVDGVSTSILQLLSDNKKMWSGLPGEIRKNKQFPKLKQAFKTAGDLFEVIPEDGKIDVVVEYDDKAKMQIDFLRELSFKSIEEKRQAIRKLQSYTVSISEGTKQKLGQAITSLCDGTILILSENYYSKETGVSEKPVGMAFLNF